jgi:two-component system OmpR family sensor kinase
LALEGLPGPLLAAAGLGLVVSLALAWLLARWISAPLRRLSRAARQVAAGDLEVQITPAGPQEARDVATAFNHMVAEVRKSQRVQRDFVANVSHELKTPLTSIQGFAQAIQDGTASDTQGRAHAAQVIYDEADRLRRLVEALLDLARLESGQSNLVMGPVDLGALLSRVADQQAVVAAKRGIQIVREWHPELPGLIGDGDRLAQVFINLFDNAVRHSPEGGRVAIQARVHGGWCSVSVTDHGPGISPQDQPRVFERFFKVDKARSGGEGRGTGLGLAISREIVIAHGGRIQVESSLGQGSRFVVELPLSRSDDTTLAHRR